MLAFDYTRRHNEVERWIHLQLCLTYKLKSSKKIKNHSAQEIIGNEKVEIKVDTRIASDIKIQYNKPDIVVIDKISKEITIIEVGIASQENLTS